MFPENVTLNKMRKYPGRWSHFVWWSRAKVNWYLNFLEKYWKFGFVHFLSEIFLNMEMFTGSEVKLVMSHLLQRLRSKSSVLLIIFQLSILRVKWHTVCCVDRDLLQQLQLYRHTLPYDIKIRFLDEDEIASLEPTM